MRLNQQTDYAFRTLVYLSLRKERLVTAQEIANGYRISYHHLTKVVQQLAQAELIHSVRGRGGGLSLACPAEEIILGDVVRVMENDMNIAECFSRESECTIHEVCQLQSVFYKARAAFLEVLDACTLADVTRNQQALLQVLEPSSSRVSSP